MQHEVSILKMSVLRRMETGLKAGVINCVDCTFESLSAVADREIPPLAVWA